LIVGGEVFVGGVGATWTTAVAAEVAVALPPLLLAVTATRIVAPTSALTRV
jgi:hypothetical protein